MNIETIKIDITNFIRLRVPVFHKLGFFFFLILVFPELRCRTDKRPKKNHGKCFVSHAKKRCLFKHIRQSRETKKATLETTETKEIAYNNAVKMFSKVAYFPFYYTLWFLNDHGKICGFTCKASDSICLTCITVTVTQMKNKLSTISSLRSLWHNLTQFWIWVLFDLIQFSRTFA